MTDSGLCTRRRSARPLRSPWATPDAAFRGENLRHNLALVDELRALAEARHATVVQIAIAWVLARGNDIVPLIGARRREQLNEALGALDVALTSDDFERIERAIPPDAAAGDRYAAPQMADLDSERG